MKVSQLERSLPIQAINTLFRGVLAQGLVVFKQIDMCYM